DYHLRKLLYIHTITSQRVVVEIDVVVDEPLSRRARFRDSQQVISGRVGRLPLRVVPRADRSLDLPHHTREWDATASQTKRRRVFGNWRDTMIRRQCDECVCKSHACVNEVEQRCDISVGAQRDVHHFLAVWTKAM